MKEEIIELTDIVEATITVETVKTDDMWVYAMKQGLKYVATVIIAAFLYFRM